ncbi:uncharacterized protein LOC117651710 [Thrips palmi]|uniref:Uncharacterized protein LOC117651710 n=1 Tax=Thrips palmi TaxID=161013 RepID=A0A6P9A367_THRPL|nr:uncharacterized protein LOC117651710 [Thrips palmi]
MLDCYDEFVCSPPGFHAFRQEKPHWLDQEPIPWSVREAAREKCNRWLQTCPLSAAARAREMSARRDTLDTDPRRRSMVEPPPPRSLTSTPALADHVPAITAVRKLKQLKK